ncbi:RDD family protein [Pseudarthrobacter sp. ATCC 49987]|uniref:RDD family protein n=1 Tax=Pseudarthrobacter sp. ATCC 49987 TaxID=2698204 RepID=UPI00136CE2AA|nr:RDD family protein [Pseudarthrobacter sp. ATCC 49987]
MTDDAERCPRCQQPLRQGAAFCTSCGTPLSNRSARNARNVRELPLAPLIPGSIPVTQGPATGRGQGGGPSKPNKLELVPAAAGKRLGAAVLDWLPPVAILTILLAIGAAGITRSQSGGFIVYDTSSLVLFGGIGAGLTVIYTVVLATLESRSGVTPGNSLMGIRSTDADGFAPGGGAVFLRGLITGAGVLLAVIATAAVMMFQWFGIALLVLGPLVFLAAAWAVVVVLSSSWDSNGKLRGWHDTAAKTLVFDVKAGRNPITTGGIQGPYSFAPLDLPPVQQVASPLAGALAAAPAVLHPHQRQPAAGVQPPVVVQQPAAAHRAAAQPSVPQPASFAPPARTAAVPPGTHPDDDHDRTQVRGDTHAPVTVAMLRIRLDDGRDIELDRTVLVGRNPAGHPGEDPVQLIPVADPGRSISKTHLHLLAGNGGVWVTDRNSTNGSAVTTPDGIRTALAAGEPTHVRPGSTVHFGDRSFYLGQA